MAAIADTWDGALSFFGRLCDELTREVVLPSDFRVAVTGVSPASRGQAEYKADGFFCFQGLLASVTPYAIEMTSAHYQPRSFLMGLPATTPVEIAYGGEDEVYVLLKTVNAATKTVGFDKFPFLPRVLAGALVIGEGGFSSTLKENLEGVDVVTATLDSVTGLAAGQLLRIVRSQGLLAKPGPYYPFPALTTRVHVKVVEDTPGEAPLGAAQLAVQTVETIAPVGTLVGGVEVKTVALPGPGPTLVLGTARDLRARTDARGQAVLFFRGDWPLTTCTVGVSAAGYVTKTVNLALLAAQRTLATVKLTPA
jgi:hypothetical protein